MRLKDKIAVVTGAASGFGEGIARRFADEGAKVVVADIDAVAGARVAQAIPNGLFCRADVADDAQVAALIKVTLETFCGLDILVNNAGVPQRNQPMIEVTEAVVDRLLAVNIKSLYLTARHAVPALRERGGGVIINTGSTAAARPRPGLVWYNGTKGAVITITKSMAVELAADGIRVNAINPVIGDTPMSVEFMGGVDTPAIRRKFIDTIPLGRRSRPTDVANAALYLASDEAEFITGVCLDVDGGRSV